MAAKNDLAQPNDTPGTLELQGPAPDAPRRRPASALRGKQLRNVACERRQGEIRVVVRSADGHRSSGPSDGRSPDRGDGAAAEGLEV